MVWGTSEHIVTKFDMHNGEVVYVLKEEFAENKVKDRAGFLDFKGFHGDTLFLAGERVGIYGIDVAFGEVKDLWRLQDFTDEGPTLYKPGAFGDFGFLPQTFHYRTIDNKYYSLRGSGLFSLDTVTGKTTFDLYWDDFYRQKLTANWSCLHGDHIYFISRWREISGYYPWTMAAFNLNTRQIDWRYDFSVNFGATDLYTPQANDNYVAVHDSARRLHVWERMK